MSIINKPHTLELDPEEISVKHQRQRHEEQWREVEEETIG